MPERWSADAKRNVTMRTTKPIVIALGVAGLAALLGGIKYAQAAHEATVDSNVVIANIELIHDAMSWNEVVGILGQPAERSFKSDAGGRDLGRFRAVWYSGQPDVLKEVAIDFNAFHVSRIDIDGKPGQPAHAAKSEPAKAP